MPESLTRIKDFVTSLAKAGESKQTQFPLSENSDSDRQQKRSVCLQELKKARLDWQP
jgi:hypothetical protein